jgi:hypothetical protein
MVCGRKWVKPAIRKMSANRKRPTSAIGVAGEDEGFATARG